MPPSSAIASWTDAGGIHWRSGRSLPTDYPATLDALIGDCRRRLASHPVLHDGRSWSWDDLGAVSARLAALLAGAVGPGDRVLIVAPNGAAHLMAELAAWRLGAIATPLWQGLPTAVLTDLVARIAPALVLHDPTVDCAAWAGGLPCLALDKALAGLPATGEERWPPPDPQRPCLLLLTSGSSGAPRGVLLSHRNLCSQQAAFGLLWPEIGTGDRLASYLPWHHSFGALAERLWALCRGATIHLVPGGGRDHEALIATVRTVRPTVFMSVPKMHALLCAAGALAHQGLKWVFTAGAPLAAREEEHFARHGIRVYEGWGLTESSPSATITPPGSRRVPGVVGEPIPGVQVGVREADHRVFVAGPGVMLGYFRDQERTRLALSGGVLDTGDLGRWDPAGLRLEGRADHRVKLANGETANAAAIERTLEQYAGIRHAVVTADGDLVAVLHPERGASDADLLLAIERANAAQPIPFLRVRRAFVLTEDPTPENGLATASQKLARGAIVARLLDPLKTSECGPLFRPLPPPS